MAEQTSRQARAGRPSASDETIAKVEAAMLEDRRTTVRELCEKDSEVSKTTIDKILTEHLGYSKVCARWVPKMLTADHKRQRVEAAQEFLAFHGTTEEEFLDSIVTGDETWVHYTTRKQRSNRSSGNTLRRQEQRSSNKSCLPGKSWLAFLGSKGRIVVRVYASRDNNQC
ncbi:histone-lysine N-methyltransferase SETMAR [Trichonephila clavipes]|nr:histone-lysine N-methyltransferase SETMAR [Trichonephila clavipes]